MAAEVQIGFVEPVIDAALATLQAQLPDQIDAYNADPGTVVTLVEPVKYAFGADDPLGVSGFPVIEVAATQGTGGQASVGLGEAGSDFDHFVVLNVVCWHEGDRGELEATYRMSLGLAKCAIECLLPAGAMGDDVSPVADESGRLALFWRTDVIPADPTADTREFRKWRCPSFVQLTLQHVDQFRAA